MFDLNLTSFQILFAVLLVACVLVIFINTRQRNEIIKIEGELTRLKGRTKFQHQVYQSSLKAHKKTEARLTLAIKNKIMHVETVTALLKAANERARKRLVTIVELQKEVEELKK